MKDKQVIRRFAYGRAAHGRRLVSLEFSDEFFVLIADGHAPLAVRHSDGTLVRFNGWYGEYEGIDRHLDLLLSHLNDQHGAKPTIPDVIGHYISFDATETIQPEESNV